MGGIFLFLLLLLQLPPGLDILPQLGFVHWVQTAAVKGDVPLPNHHFLDFLTHLSQGQIALIDAFKLLEHLLRCLAHLKGSVEGVQLLDAMLHLLRSAAVFFHRPVDLRLGSHPFLGLVNLL